MMVWIQGRRLARAIMAERIGMGLLGAAIAIFASIQWPEVLGVTVHPQSLAERFAMGGAIVGAVLMVIGQILGSKAIEQFSDHVNENEAVDA